MTVVDRNGTIQQFSSTIFGISNTLFTVLSYLPTKAKRNDAAQIGFIKTMTDQF